MSDEHFRITDPDETRISLRNVENDPDLRTSELKRNQESSRYRAAHEIASICIDLTYNSGRMGPLKSTLMRWMYASLYAAELLNSSKKKN